MKKLQSHRSPYLSTSHCSHKQTFQKCPDQMCFPLTSVYLNTSRLQKNRDAKLSNSWLLNKIFMESLFFYRIFAYCLRQIITLISKRLSHTGLINYLSQQMKALVTVGKKHTLLFAFLIQLGNESCPQTHVQEPPCLQITFFLK